MNDLEIIKNELSDYLKKEEIDDKVLEKKLFELIKNCLKNKINEINLGNYTINIIPENLKVTYNTICSYLEYSNQDIYEEFEVVDNTKYYIIKNIDNNYSESSPVIRVNNSIIKSSPNYSEDITYELLNAPEDNINNYLKNTDEITIESPYIAIANKYFEPEDNRLNEEKYLDLNKVMLVKKQIDGGYKPTYREEKEKYTNLIPNLEMNKIIITKIYNILVNFYKQYI